MYVCVICHWLGDYTVDIKKALACLLMGGSRFAYTAYVCMYVCKYVCICIYTPYVSNFRKVLPDGLKLRGDINILLMGDPVTYIHTYKYI